ncbi:MAG: hypothetical protein ABIY55_11085 [Kofleriaceae bacterium]
MGGDRNSACAFASTWQRAQASASRAARRHASSIPGAVSMAWARVRTSASWAAQGANAGGSAVLASEPASVRASSSLPRISVRSMARARSKLACMWNLIIMSRSNRSPGASGSGFDGRVGSVALPRRGSASARGWQLARTQPNKTKHSCA